MAKNVHEARESQFMAYEDQLSHEKQMQWRFLMQPIYQAYWLKKKEKLRRPGSVVLVEKSSRKNGSLCPTGIGAHLQNVHLPRLILTHL